MLYSPGMEDDEYPVESVVTLMASIQQNDLALVEANWERERQAAAALRAQQENPGLTMNELLGLAKKAEDNVGGVDEAAQAYVEDEKKQSALAFQKIGKFPPPPTTDKK